MRHQLAMRPRYLAVSRRGWFTRVCQAVLDRFLLLPLGAIWALVWANVSAESYFQFSLRFAFVVNEIGMAFFFALITQEVVEATMPRGALHSWRGWSLPIVAAAGGAAGAVAVYFAYVGFKYESVLFQAWPILLSIDVVSTYYILRTILRRRSGALSFALALAIVTDLVAVILVAPHYDVLETRAGAAGLIVIGLGLAALLRIWKVRRFWPYIFLCGPLVWLGFYWGGLHPAFALVPIVPFLPHEPRNLDLFADPTGDDAVHRAEHEWNDLVQVVVFLFGLVNAGVTWSQYDTGSWAVLLAALVGRPLGILAAIGIGSLAGLHLPRRVGWRESVVMAFATSSGFIVGLFLATGLIGPGPLLSQIKLGLLGSAVGALVAFGAARALRVGRYAR
jgi:Na+:H+ antiporter, NhaA family